jgi:hypothetical protein
MREQMLQQGQVPSGGMAPNKDREFRLDAVELDDAAFMAKWGIPKPGGGQ